MFALESILTTVNTAGAASIGSLLLCTGASLALGVAGALLYMYKNTYTKSFAVTLALLPAIVQMVIMLVNGNLGTGVAVMGAFSLVRFRSAPGGAREICSLFLAMALGLATGMGYVFAAAVFLGIVGLCGMLLCATRFGEQSGKKLLKITIPEDLDYTGVFDDLFAQYTRGAELVNVRTTNLGSLYELRYHIKMADAAQEKKFLDALRCRNGNLTIVLGKIPHKDEL